MSAKFAEEKDFYHFVLAIWTLYRTESAYGCKMLTEKIETNLRKRFYVFQLL